MSKPEYQVLFSHNWSPHRGMEPNTIVIVPSSDKWNDFGHRTMSDIYIKVSAENPAYQMTASLGFIAGGKDDSPAGLQVVEAALRDADGALVEPAALPGFFTMLKDMRQYRDLVQALSPRTAADILAAVNDVVYLNDRSPRPTWLNKAVESDVFNLSFLRSSEAHFAYRNAGSVLSGLEFETFGEISTNLRVTFQLNGRPNAHDLTFRFDALAELPKRIAVVIGQNGMGKSQVLSRAARAAIEGDKKILSDPDRDRPVLINRLLAFAPTNEMREVFPNDRRKHSKIWYRRFALNRMSIRKSEAGLSDTIVQLARSNEHILRKSRWDFFMNAMRVINDWSQIALPGKGGYHATALFNLKRFGEQESLEQFARIDLSQNPVRLIDDKEYPLSSGEVSFIRFAAIASLNIENGSLLLFDEPETHLHPYFISQFVALLDDLLQNTNSLAIIATHSVYFVREVFEDQVVVLRNGPQYEVLAAVPTLRTFGADVGAISYFVFGQDEPSNLASVVSDEVVEKDLSWPEVFEKYKDELSPELLGMIRERLEGPQETVRFE